MIHASDTSIAYFVEAWPSNLELNALFAAAWPSHRERDFVPILSHSLTYVMARHQRGLIGFINLAWDGGVHGFLLDTTVHPDFQRRGIGRELVQRAIQVGRIRGLEWIHVDYEIQLHGFYESCGFRPSAAGVMKLSEVRLPPAFE